MSGLNVLKKSLILMAAVALAFCGSSLMAQEGKQVVVESLDAIENPDSEFEVKLWVDRENATYKVGDEVKFFFKTNKDCYLTLLDVGTSGDVKIIFPNKYQKDNLVKAGITYTVPPEGARWIYKADKPAGKEIVKAIATLKEIPLYTADDVKPTEPFEEFKKSEQEVAKDITLALKPVNTKKWAEAEKIIEIVE